MRPFIYFTILLLWTADSFGQIIRLQDNETARQFAERQKPENSTLTHEVLETKWNEVPVVVAFYGQTYTLSIQDDPDRQTYHKIVGAVFIQVDEDRYNKTTFGPVDTEGGRPIIETVFFANADDDKTKELIVIASWEQRHYDVNGTLYGTYVFDYERTWKTPEWEFIEGISKKLDGGCECRWREGPTTKARFKTASEVEDELTRLGYTQ